MYVLISYDIVDDRIRIKVMKYLKNYGVRAQKSVYECHLNEDQFDMVKDGLGAFIDKKKDSVRFYKICQSCMEKVEIAGWGVVDEEEDFSIL